MRYLRQSLPTCLAVFLLAHAVAAGTVSFNLPLAPGWNLVSVPIVPDAPDAAAVFGATIRSPVWGWDGIAWKTVTDIAPGRGYWVWAPTTSEVRIEGVPAGERLLRLRRGWNLVGAITDAAFTAVSVPLKISPDAALQSCLLGWGGQSYFSPSSLAAGRGYWLYATAECVADCAVTLQSLALEPATVTTAPGHSQAYTVTATWSDTSPLPSPTTLFCGVTLSAEPAAMVTVGGLNVTVNRQAAPGPVTITAFAAGKTASATLTVPRAATGLTLSPASATLAPGDVLTYTVTALYNDGSHPAVTSPDVVLSADPAAPVTIDGLTVTVKADAVLGAFGINAAYAGQNALSTVTVSRDYLVVDISAGPAATSYPVNYLGAAPADLLTHDQWRTTKILLRKITHGLFTMGSPATELGRAADETQHQVTLTQDYYLAVFEVTQKQWERVMNTWPSNFSVPNLRDPRPVEQVSYAAIRGGDAGTGWPANNSVDASSFMGKLRQKTGLALFDLPTEAQWEYACRAGTTTALNNNTNLTNISQEDPNLALLGRYWLNGGSDSLDPATGGSAAVGSYQPNAWGLYDMHGNVWEWCLDWYGIYMGAMTDPRGAVGGARRVVRGGSLDSLPGDCRAARRGPIGPDIGFRLAMPAGTP